MGATLAHRGPDDEGAWWEPSVRLGFSHRRLSIVDVTAAGHQPMTSASKRITLSFNGEIYNAEEIRRELGTHSHIAWRGHSDTEVMVEAIEQWGMREALRKFNGMFAVSLYDRTTRTLHLARDGLGKKPLYYGWVGGCFVFASELKAIAVMASASGCASLGVDRGALVEFLRLGCVGGTRCIHPGLSKLAPGTIASIVCDTETPVGAVPTMERFWDARHELARGTADELAGSDDECEAALKAALTRAVGRRLVGDVDIGAMLSGGVDSSVIVALMSRATAGRVRTFTIGFDDPDYDESDEAARVAEALGTDHTLLRVSAKEAMEVVPRLGDIYDEPFADSSQIPSMLVSALARSRVRAALSGDGADELFGGYDRYRVAPRLYRSLSLLPVFARIPLARGLGSLAHLLPASSLRRNRDKIARGVAALSASSPSELHRLLASNGRDVERLVVGARDMTPTTDLRSEPIGGGALARFLMDEDVVTYLVDDLLVKVDRASMSVGLEVRSPFLDREVVELAARLPMSMKIRGGEGKWILKRLADRLVPGGLPRRPKTGFAVPVHDWLRAEMRPWAEELLAPERLAREGLLVPREVRSRWEQFLRGRHDERHLIWALLMFQSWNERE